MEASLAEQVWETILNHIGGTVAGACLGALSAAGAGVHVYGTTPIVVADLIKDSGLPGGYVRVCFRVLEALGLCNSHLNDKRGLICQLTDSAIPLLEAKGWMAGFEKSMTAGLALQDNQKPDFLPPSLDLLSQNYLFSPFSPLYVSAMVTLSMDRSVEDQSPLDLFHGYSMEVLSSIGWSHRKGNSHVLTKAGTIAFQLAPQYYHTAAYLKLFTGLPDLLCRRPVRTGYDTHLRRDIDIASSSRVFNSVCRKGLAKIITPIFNQPLFNQPICIVDTGCGEGTLLEAVFEEIFQKTKRGKSMATHPLTLIGVDPSPVARKATSERLSKKGIPHLVLDGEISNPQGLARQMADHGFDAKNALHCSKSVFHNRVIEIDNDSENRVWKTDSRTVFCNQNGRELPSEMVEHDLRAVLEKWMPFARKHGLVIVEAHTVNPENLIKKEYGNILACLDASHGFSGQFLLESHLFQQILGQAGYVVKHLEYIGDQVFGAPVMSVGWYGIRDGSHNFTG